MNNKQGVIVNGEILARPSTFAVKKIKKMRAFEKQDSLDKEEAAKPVETNLPLKYDMRNNL